MIWLDYWIFDSHFQQDWIPGLALPGKRNHDHFELSLIPFLFLKKVEKHTEIGIFTPAEMHLLLYFEVLVTKLYIGVVGGKTWKQTGPIMFSLNDCKFVWKHLDKFSTCWCPESFRIFSLLLECSDWVYILLSNKCSSQWDNPNYLQDFE